MRNPTLFSIACCFVTAAGCASSSEPRSATDPASTEADEPEAVDSAAESPRTAGAAAETDGDSAVSETFDPPAARSGYKRFVAPVMKDLPPGTDTMVCQYVQAPLDRDLDVLDVTGFQSTGGHHSIAYATTAAVPVGTSRLCDGEDKMQGGFLGGIGGEGSGGVKLPAGVAYRLPKGSSIMLNTHFLNTTDHEIDGQTVIDFRFVEVDPTRKVASLFSIGTTGFKVPVHAEASAMTDCTFPQDMQFILFTNHMHDNGTRAKTELVRADGTIELVHEDPVWTYEMQFNAEYTQWTLDEPLTIAKGDTLRTHCSWQNGTEDELMYPREMCFGVGFFLSDGSSAPVCINGGWINRNGS